MTFLQGFNFLVKCVILALLVETVAAVILDVWGTQAQATNAQFVPESGHLANGDPAYDGTSTLGQLQLYGHYMTAFILLSGIIGCVVQMFKPDSRDTPVAVQYRRGGGFM